MAETTTSTYTTRFATESDIPAILSMINELAMYENALDEVQATPETLRTSLTFPSNPSQGFAKTLLIFPASDSLSNNPAGMVVYFNNYSTWLAAPGIYIEDLYVHKEQRGKGYGKALLQALARECVATGCKRLQWSVLDWNKPSIDFYESEAIGAKATPEWIGMRVDGEALVKLGGQR